MEMTFNARRLFANQVSPADLHSHGAFLDRATGERLRGNSDESRAALAGYLVARLVERFNSLQPVATADESFRWQLESTRRFVAELPADSTEAAFLMGVLDAFTAVPEVVPAMVRTNLTAYAYFLEREGRYAEAVQTLGAVARTYAGEIPAHEFGSMAQTCGRLNRFLAQWDAADAGYAAAGEAAAVCRELRGQLLARLGRANVLRDRGNLPASRAAVEAVIAEAEPPECSDVRGRAYNDLAAVLERQGFLADSIAANYRALEQFRDQQDRCRTLGDLGIALKSLGHYEMARDAFDLVVHCSESWTLRTNAEIEAMDLESACGNEIPFRRLARELAVVAARMTPSMAVDYRFRAGLGHARFGHLRKGRKLMEEANELARRDQLNYWYFLIERVLQNLESCPCAGAEPAVPGRLDGAPAIHEVGAGLRRLVLVMEEAG